MEIEDLLDDENEEVEDESGVSAILAERKNKSASQKEIPHTRPERITVTNSEFSGRKRGRPVGSKNNSSKTKTTSDSTQPEKFWISASALGLNWASLLAAGYIFHDKKFIMSRQEAEAAAKGIMIVAFRYQQFRDFAVIVNGNSDMAVIVKGFMPYLTRVLFKDLITDVFNGLVFPGPQRSTKTNGAASTGNATPSGRNEQSNVGVNLQSHVGRDKQNDVQPFTPEINGFTDWRDVG